MIPLTTIGHKQRRNRNYRRVWPVAPTSSIGTTTTTLPFYMSGATAVFGVGEGGTPTATTIRGAIATGTDIPGANLAIRPANGTGTGGSGSLVFQTAAAGATSATTNSMATRLQITSGGNVGVGGVTTPMNKLDVEGNMVVGATYSGTNTAPTNGLLVQGYVGIGTTTVAAPLHVAGTSAIFGVGEGGTPTATTIRGAIATGTDIPGANLAIRPANGTGTGGSGSLIFQTAAAGATSATANTMATRLQITSGGNVGVGGYPLNGVSQIHPDFS